MKYIKLTALILLIAIVSKGQTDTAKIKLDKISYSRPTREQDSLNQATSSTKGPITIPALYTPVIVGINPYTGEPAYRDTILLVEHFDTVKVVMLVSDIFKTPAPKGTTVMYSVYAQIGYDLRQYEAFYQNQTFTSFGYLDENKKPLSKTIVIWNCQRISE